VYNKIQISNIIENEITIELGTGDHNIFKTNGENYIISKEDLYLNTKKFTDVEQSNYTMHTTIIAVEPFQTENLPGFSAKIPGWRKYENVSIGDKLTISKNNGNMLTLSSPNFTVIPLRNV
jgi:hypothetical protein